MAGRRTGNALISGMLFIIVALVAGFITAAFTDSSLIYSFCCI